MVEINITKPTKINIKTIKMYLKIRDEMSFSLYDSEKSCIATYEGYVPHVLIPGEYGDYMNLEIDIDTGQILNWIKPDSAKLTNFIEYDTGVTKI